MTSTHLQRISQQVALIPDPIERKAIELIGVQDREILLASLTGPKVNMMTDKELDRLVISIIAAGVLKLGHKNQLDNDQDLGLFSDGIAALIREKWAHLTETEVRLVFKMGVRGDFRTDPKEVIYLNEPNIAAWFKAYKYQRKAEATLHKQKLMGSLERQQPAKEMSQEEIEEMNIERLETELERLAQPGEAYREFDLGNVLFFWLESLGVIALTNAEKLEILNKERQMLRAERKSDKLDLPTKLSYKQFDQALNANTYASGNRYEEEAKNRARKQAFRGFILATLEAGHDIRTLIMEQIHQTNRKSA